MECWLVRGKKKLIVGLPHYMILIEEIRVIRVLASKMKAIRYSLSFQVLKEAPNPAIPPWTLALYIADVEMCCEET
jgi:hypothetical protein